MEQSDWSAEDASIFVVVPAKPVPHEGHLDQAEILDEGKPHLAFQISDEGENQDGNELGNRTKDQVVDLVESQAVSPPSDEYLKQGDEAYLEILLKYASQ